MKKRSEMTRDPRKWLIIFLCGLTGLLILSMIILASVPPISRDALVHHLAIPKLYLKHGAIYEIPFMIFSYYPMNLDLLYLIPLSLGKDIMAKFIHFSFALLTACLIFYYLRRRINILYAFLGAVFFLSIPIIIKLSITVYVDLGLVFFSTASLLLVLKWLECGFRVRFLILSALFCGLAMGTKYNGLITFLILTLLVPFIYSRYNNNSVPGFVGSVRYGVLFLCIALILFSPWMIRNYLWTYNPIFPLYNEWLNPQQGVIQRYMSLFTIRSSMYDESWWQIALLPVRIFFEGRDGDPQYFDGRLNPFLLFLPFFAFYQIGADPRDIRNEKKIMLAFVFLFFAFAFFGKELRIRYISPIIPMLVILSIFGCSKMVERVNKFRSQFTRKIAIAGIVLILCVAFLMNAYYLLNQYKYVDPFTYINGTLTRDEYIEKYRPEYPAMRYMNENLPMDARILFIFVGNRGYYCDREYIFDMNNNRSMLHKFLMASETTEELLLRIQGKGITHLLIFYNIFDQWVKDSLTIEEQTFLKQFFQKHVRLMYLKWGYGISRLGNST